MSTQNGDRAALVVIKNMASGQRILDSKHIVAIIADGTRVFGNLTDAKVKLAGQEQITIKLEFGTFDYPIVSLYTSQSET
jgi:limonene-1,2-epoxide hydrolase